MLYLFKTKTGRLRILAILEGCSLLGLVFLAVPMKYVFHEAIYTKILGPIHGALFLLFAVNTLSLAIEENWHFKRITLKVLLACFIPFGTFYIDRKILRKMTYSKE